jgi:hypothetical protein
MASKPQNTQLKYDRSVAGPLTFTNIGSTAANQFFGTTGLAATTVTVSTALVSSQSIILLTLAALSSINSNGATPLAVGVQSISDGGFFNLGPVTSVSLTGSYQVSWLILNPKT